MIRTQKAFDLVGAELKSATERYGAFNSAHEGYAVLILEEIDPNFGPK